MTPEQVAKNFHGECQRDHWWCVTHQCHWPEASDKWPVREETPYCPVMADFIDLAEQAVEDYRADLRAQVEALRARPIASFDGYTGQVALDQVLALFDEARS